LKGIFFKLVPIAAVGLLLYTVIGGLLLPVPHRFILNETIRNLYFHVPMWFTMMLLFGISVVSSILYLYEQDEKYDIVSAEYINTGLVFAICGLVTGMMWAKFAWGTWWSFSDPKLNGAAIMCLEYFAYVILRSSIAEERTRAKVSAVYNIFAAASLIPLLFIIPRVNDSLHPGNGGNPAFKSYDLDFQMRLVFYPAVVGWMALGLWIADLKLRIRKLEDEVLENS
jgi:heme exporter protein C